MNIVKSKKQKKYFKIIILLLIIMIVLVMLNIMREYLTVSKLLELNWNITIPSDLKEEYYIDTGSSFHGDGERYSIFSGSKLIMNFNNQKDKKLEQKVYKSNKKLNIPKENQIDFAHEYVWEKIVNRNDERDELYIIYDCELNKYYFYELFV